VSAIQELLGKESSGFGLESREYGRKFERLIVWILSTYIILLVAY
jgi:hypothetical protein